MFGNWKKKLAQKKANNKFLEESRHWKTNALLQDCLNAMRGYCTIVPPEMHEAVITATNIAIREDIWTTAEEVTSIAEDFFPGMVYILWDEAHLPVLKAPWAIVEENLHDVRRVNLDTFLMAETMDRIIWFAKDCQIKLYSVT